MNPKNKNVKIYVGRNTHRYIDILGELFKKYKTSYHRSIRMSPTKASNKPNESIVWNHLNSDTTEPHKSKFKVGNRVRISKKRTTFENGYKPNWTEEVFEIVDIQNTNPGTCKVIDFNGEPVNRSYQSYRRLPRMSFVSRR